MARLAFLFYLSLLFTFSHARFLTADEISADLPESNPESTTSILLPSKRPDHDDASETDSGIGSIPLTMIRFHPVTRHFPRRPLIPFRHKHSCRFHKRFRSLNPRFHQKGFISYGNDMILSDDRSFDPESHGVVRQVDDRWGSFHDDDARSKHHDQDREDDHHHHHHHHDNEEEDDHHSHDHDDDHHHHRHHHKEGEEGEKEHRGGGFMEKFRRFFIHF
ncbi:Pectin lyase-like superfamily protein [Hibiscus syriacus]|uniref:Pectin lyase-like superfamily protein n=1 Tax=Hibiscus syriacus TaxID=106335 RepID=A0A6A3BPZ9_HIBSY|nr:Pectin lyase-like superfamily protein [Hibiscus syriacus]